MAKRKATATPTTAWFVISPEGSPLPWTGTHVEQWSIKTYVDFKSKILAVDWAALTKDGYRCLECTITPMKTT
jgi:hypothetical protein